MPDIHIGLLLFPDLTQLDLTGPYEVFRKTPGIVTHLLAPGLEPVRAESGLRLLPDTTFADCPPLDVICVPGGPGVNAAMEDEELLRFLRAQATGARYVTSVCTGALVLGAAGLLQGRRATTHWTVHDLLAAFGAIPVQERVVRDGNLVTGGGVTAGIDFALTLVAELLGASVAQSVQLGLEYAPAPPFQAGTPQTAPAEILQAVRARGAAMRARREEIIKRVTERPGLRPGPARGHKAP
ncbi:Isonitrile hydratase [Rhodovastum atsumiense]|uniref:DJ-1/PfpI family protein n=1 Tax=Rhodovastum atsumiense TaxID=504468 RepID=A0A5M6IXL2_9PROT|nr:DJ-1/PfpI family protein [Rhodovastum atsumiense]KAA5613032.1 DJ-1/PfpI family protein [Rhodovastum atsumiense]CAH2600113.1 Isonitrile hydratase [Rhodovastum atsumiense]